MHPGGPFWAKKDKGAWSIPKGQFSDGEDKLSVAKREFGEELGQPPPEGEYLELGSSKQLGGKTVYIWALKGDFDVSQIKSNTFEIEWPPKSGQKQKFPEVDRAEWFDLATASEKIHPGQEPFIKNLAAKLGVEFSPKIDDSDTKNLSQQQISLL